jgi:hypothetical protein
VAELNGKLIRSFAIGIHNERRQIAWEGRVEGCHGFDLLAAEADPDRLEKSCPPPVR